MTGISVCIDLNKLSDVFNETVKEWFDVIQTKLTVFKDREDKLKMKLKRIYTDIDFKNLALVINKKSTTKVDVLVNGIPMEDAHKYEISLSNDELVFEFQNNKNKIFVFNLEDYFLEFFINPEFIFEKYISS
jgi:hypothetical protein